MKSLDKNTQSDYRDPWSVLPVYTTAIVAASHGGAIKTEISPSDSALAALPCIPVNGAKALLVKVWANASGGAVSLQFLSKRHKGSNTAAMPSNTVVGAFTNAGLKCVSANPFTGAADATDSWWATSAFTANTAAHCDNRVTQYPSSSVSTGDIYFGIDALGEEILIPWCYGLTTASKFLIGFARVE